MRIHLITAESPESRRLRGSRLIQFPQLTMPLIAALTPREHANPRYSKELFRALTPLGKGGTSQCTATAAMDEEYQSLAATAHLGIMFGLDEGDRGLEEACVDVTTMSMFVPMPGTRGSTAGRPRAGS